MHTDISVFQIFMWKDFMRLLLMEIGSNHLITKLCDEPWNKHCYGIPKYNGKICAKNQIGKIIALRSTSNIIVYYNCMLHLCR